MRGGRTAGALRDLNVMVGAIDSESFREFTPIARERLRMTQPAESVCRCTIEQDSEIDDVPLR
jgi:hypothetical protein